MAQQDSSKILINNFMSEAYSQGWYTGVMALHFKRAVVMLHGKISLGRRKIELEVHHRFREGCN